jgi:hypothetical protein
MKIKDQEPQGTQEIISNDKIPPCKDHVVDDLIYKQIDPNQLPGTETENLDQIERLILNTPTPFKGGDLF